MFKQPLRIEPFEGLPGEARAAISEWLPIQAAPSRDTILTARLGVYELTDRWLRENLGEPVIQGRDATTGLIQLNMNGVWNRTGGNSVMMTRKAAMWTRLATDLFVIKHKKLVDTQA